MIDIMLLHDGYTLSSTSKESFDPSSDPVLLLGLSFLSCLSSAVMLAIESDGFFADISLVL